MGLHKGEHYQQWHSFSKQTHSSTSTKATPSCTNQQPQDDSEMRRVAWEAGNPDYLGKDAFKNIKKALDESMAAEKP